MKTMLIIVLTQTANGDISERPKTPRSSATVIQAAFRKLKARKNMFQLLDSIYERIYDPHSGHCYYLHKITGEARWEKPILLGGSTDLEYRPHRRPGVEEFLNARQQVVSQLYEEEAVAASKMVFGKVVRFVRLSLQSMRAESSAIVEGENGEVVDDATEFDSVVVMVGEGAKVRSACVCVLFCFVCMCVLFLVFQYKGWTMSVTELQLSFFFVYMYVRMHVGYSEVHSSAVVEPSPFSNQLLVRTQEGLRESRAG